MFHANELVTRQMMYTDLNKTTRVITVVVSYTSEKLYREKRAVLLKASLEQRSPGNRVLCAQLCSDSVCRCRLSIYKRITVTFRAIYMPFHRIFTAIKALNRTYDSKGYESKVNAFNFCLLNFFL